MAAKLARRTGGASLAAALLLVALAAPSQPAARAQQLAATINHHDHSNFGLYSAPPAAANSPAGQQQQQQQHQHQHQAGGAQRTPRVGQAPQERPACQLQAHKRRHLAAGEPSQQQQQQQQELAAPLPNASQPADQQRLAAPLITSIGAANNNKTGPAGNNQDGLEAPSLASQARARVDTGERLRQLRQLLIANHYDAYLVTSKDEHGSEYVSNYDRRLRFISGFAGSNGLALVLLDRAVLFTDGRYELQAEAELDCNWALVVGDPQVDVPRWLAAQSNARALRVATDARLMSLQTFDYLEEILKRQFQSEFALISQDLVDVVWDNHASGAGSTAARERPSGPLQVQPLEFAGQVSWQEKVLRLASSMERLRARHYVVSKLDDIAWLLNLRGSDIPMAPLFKAYLLVSRQPASAPPATSGGQATSQAPAELAAASKPPSVGLEQLLLGQHSPAAAPSDQLQAPQVLQVPAGQVIRLTLYVDLRKAQAAAVREHLRLDNWTSVQQAAGEPLSRLQVETRDYELFIADFRDKFGSTTSNHLSGRLLLDAMANVAIHCLAKNYDDRLILMEPLITRLKSVKSELEVAGMRQAHWRDSLAIAMLLSQLELDVGELKRTERWTETSAARALESYRAQMDLNRGQSFETISAYGPNGAIVHYRPQEVETSANFIGNQSTYLLDSGGQYLDGTTDITRTVHFGRPSNEEREMYTRVLMGAIDMMSLVFERAATTYRLDDLIARRHLMEVGRNYEHGTGHGIGAYSLVHEAPWLIEPRAGSSSAPAASKLTGGAGGQPAVLNEPQPLEANMFTSVEPGFYKPGHFGVRLENIVVTRRHPAGAAPNATNWLAFEPLSLVPFEPRLIKFELLSNKQKAWLNSYNLMVRLRMTHQVNHYLTRARAALAQQQQQLGQVASGSGELLSSSTRLYQRLQARNNTTSEQLVAADAELKGHFRPRMEAGKLQELLEQAHRWIMAKTEFIPLDVPQQMIRPPPPPQEDCSQPEAPLAARMKQPSQPARGDEWSALGAEPAGQRLMLAYMSSAPFNDPEAARAVATLTARSLAANDSTASWPQKCSGIECDLLLLEALNSHQQSLGGALPAAAPAAGQQQHRRRQTISAQLEGDEEGAPKTGGALLDLFQLNAQSPDAPGWLSLANVWPLLGLALLLTLQLAVMAYVCGGGGGGGRNGGRKPRARDASATPSPSGSRRASQSMALAQTALAQQQQQQQWRRDSAGHLSQSGSLAGMAGAPLAAVAEVAAGGERA